MVNKRKRKHHRKNRGTITVFVTLIMIPVILLNAFIVDMGRVKLYGDQALMAADNYAEAALTDYDNLLKEMYGLFAMAQSEEGAVALNQIQAIVGDASFNPNKNIITPQSTLSNPSFDGFMPYSSADISYSLKYPDDANLDNNNVLQTQIGDFMRFRIIQETMQAVNGSSIEEADQLFEILGQCNDLDKDSEITEKKLELDNKIADLYVSLYCYYMFLYGYEKYPDYLAHVNSGIQNVVSDLRAFYDGDEVRKFYDYVNRDENDEEEDLKWAGYNALQAQLRIIRKCEETKDDLSNLFYTAKNVDDLWQNAAMLKDNDIKLHMPLLHPQYYVGWYMGDIERFATDFYETALDLDFAITQYEFARELMKTALEKKQPTDEFRQKVESDIREADELIGIFTDVDSGYSRDDFVNLAFYLGGNIERDLDYVQQFKDIVSDFGEIEDPMSEGIDIEWDSYTSMEINYDDYTDFMNVSSYRALRDKLYSIFYQMDPDEEKQQRDKEKAANDKTKEAQKELENETYPDNLRDIPSSYTVSSNGGHSGAFDPLGSIKEVASYFKGSLGDAGTKLILKYYTISYDFGMFSSRVSRELSGKSGRDLENKDVVFESLVGVKYDTNANYMYGAELEYIFAGYRNAIDNLEASRNTIVGFRAIMNYKSTYTVNELNSALEIVRAAGNSVLPGLGYVVEQAIRLSITTLESVDDWKRLKNGELVLFDKKEIGDFGIVKSLGSFFTNGELDDTEKKSGGLKLSYNQYLRIMVILLTPNETVINRTRDLVTLNMNLVDQYGKLGDDGILKNQTFYADKAYTAIESTCSVHLDFAVMPQEFLNMVADDNVSSEISEFGKSYFNFTMVRGY